jgi:hypothetical protein
VEELLTTVILVSFNFALDVRDIVTHQTKVPAYYEVENSNHIAEVRPLPHHHLHNIQRGHLTEKARPGPSMKMGSQSQADW